MNSLESPYKLRSLCCLSVSEIICRLGVALYYEYSRKQGVIIVLLLLSLIFEVIMPIRFLHLIKEVLEGVVAAVLGHKLIKLFALPNYL